MDNISPVVALDAVLTYRLYGTDSLVEEIFNPSQRGALQTRVDELRAYQSKDANDAWIDGQFDSVGKVDYMAVSFR
jgi:hypothetical protein